MLFEEKKLTSESIDELLHCPIHSVEPYALMLAPVYVLMKLNEKLVSVKAPLDFFTEDELSKLTRYDTFYLPQFARFSARFQTAARLSRSILTSMEKEIHVVAPFEVSTELQTTLGPLWSKQEKVEPFFMAIFADELCNRLDPELLVKSRERAVVLHDLGLLLSGAFVFISLQIKFFTHSDISRIRTEIYSRTVEGETWESPKSEDEVLVRDLYRILGQQREISRELVDGIRQEWARKLSARLKRYADVRKRQNIQSPSIFGPEGFAA